MNGLDINCNKLLLTDKNKSFVLIRYLMTENIFNDKMNLILSAGDLVHDAEPFFLEPIFCNLLIELWRNPDVGIHYLSQYLLNNEGSLRDSNSSIIYKIGSCIENSMVYLGTSKS